MSTNNDRIDITIHTPRHAAPRIPWFRRLATWLGLADEGADMPVAQVSVPAKNIKSVSVTDDYAAGSAHERRVDVDRLLHDLAAQGGETR
ncbi:hypothetical protein BSR29_02860 [Boudabousia liubingyangii]|uniref:Uncharacterized protein n=1 Tax=Boudabousia liubingyangii TaxID=1921764 RepID=A0A1Q5PMN7_9ACTO|nr:hypothetical protein [Boudabousia liubingyangii]OKL48814.1 hypothetical protein BSR29_02860 [Boudabousia liubingyangii]